MIGLAVQERQLAVLCARGPAGGPWRRPRRRKRGRREQRRAGSRAAYVRIAGEEMAGARGLSLLRQLLLGWIGLAGRGHAGCHARTRRAGAALGGIQDRAAQIPRQRRSQLRRAGRRSRIVLRQRREAIGPRLAVGRVELGFGGRSAMAAHRPRDGRHNSDATNGAEANQHLARETGDRNRILAEAQCCCDLFLRRGDGLVHDDHRASVRIIRTCRSAPLPPMRSSAAANSRSTIM